MLPPVAAVAAAAAPEEQLIVVLVVALDALVVGVAPPQEVAHGRVVVLPLFRRRIVH